MTVKSDVRYDVVYNCQCCKIVCARIQEDAGNFNTFESSIYAGIKHT